ncbi:hypothetical protein S7W_24755 [Mycobacteroides abscessus M94]|nr:hypothetical protein S7W_24755 [Mycobacteroides abscessus M94]
MANKWDIEALRGEGLQAIANSQNYVTAAIRGNGKSPVTITNPDLTANERQLFDWYDMDAGMDLNTLGGDLELFKNATATMKAAAERQHGQLQRLIGLWEGKGSESANDFLKTHNSTADAVTDEFGKVSTGLDGLRNALWNIVDLKKQASTMVDGLVTDRTHFDSAVATYKTGMGDKSQADETNATMIGPHVKNNIEGQLLPAFKKAWSAGGGAYDTLINGLKQELPPDFKLPPGVFGPDYDTTDEPAKTTKGKGKQDDKDGGETSGESGESGNSGVNSGAGGGTASGGMQGTATPASATGNAGGQLSGAGQQQGAGQGQQGMDPSQMLSGMTGALTGALSSIGQAASGIVSAITEGISSIPFDQMGQGLGDDQFDGRADEAADKKDEAAADGGRRWQEGSGRQDGGGQRRCHRRSARRLRCHLRYGWQAGTGHPAGGCRWARAAAPGQTTPGAPLGATPTGTIPPAAGGLSAAQPAGSSASLTPHPVQAQPPTVPQHPEPQSAAARQPSPLPSVGPTDASAQPQEAKTEAGETPCEIAADELPKAGR